MDSLRPWVAAVAGAMGWLFVPLCSDAQVRIRLKNGGFIAGEMASQANSGNVAIKNENFAAPLELQVAAIRSIDQLDRDQLGQPTKQTFLLAGGNAISGELTRLDAQSVTVKSPSLGEVTFARDLLREFSDSSFAGRLVYSGPRTGLDWKSTEKPEDWSFEAGAIATSKAGASIVGDVNLPDKCEVRFALSWTRTPDFVLSLGCAKDSKAEDNNAAMRLEIWDGSLAMVREVGGNADVALISDYSAENNRLNLIVYLDQAAGIAAVSTVNGKLLERLELKSEKVVPGRFVKLSNHSQENYQSVFRLERFEVREWDGHLPDSNGDAARQVIGAKGEAIDGTIGNYNAATGEVQILHGENPATAMKVDDIRRALFSTATSEETKPTAPLAVESKAASSATNKSESPVAEAATAPAIAGTDWIEVELSDRSRLAGKWLESTAGKVAFEVNSFASPLTFDVSQVVGLVGNSDPYKPANLPLPQPHPKGRLISKTCELSGSLAEHTGSGIKTFLWQADSAVTPVAMTESSEGKVEFGAISAASQRAKATAELKDPVAPRAMILRERAAVTRATPSPRPRRMTIGLEFRTGDVVEGKVTAIDEKGVTFASDSTSTTFVPHVNLESVTLRPNREAVNETPLKLERLMTVPRSMKADPPTHLLVSTNGDYLRGRLVSLNESLTTVEIRLENVELPTDQIAQIYWLHDREWDKPAKALPKVDHAVDTPAETRAPAVESDEQAAAAEPFQVHAIRKDGRGLTFVPLALLQGKLSGTSLLLGDCEQALDELQVILFGRDVGSQARALKKELWKLSLAQLPKVYQEGENAAGENQSPLVGKPAPDFTLQSLDDQPQQLSKSIGKVVVLDFWASWCGPCMKTMPEVDRVVKEVGADQVELIAVNLQEGKERINTAMARLAISANVVLDVDGEVAQLYQANAIPQTVIIDRTGIVTHLFVGGGNKFVEDFTTALKATIDLK